ncbi:HTH domain-containing protein [Haloterrigena salinisoli]|uniref:HTH domain-containing protein n=1 Tax=Haloterrigena salinisoli TaxID=3132747 RepID=UPI0030D2AE6E
MSNPTTTPTTIELWIRSFAPASAGPTQERALERLAELESHAPIESVEVSVWGKEVEVDRPERAMRIPQLCRIERRLEAFENWAARTGRRLEPFFRNTHVESSITGESHDVWRLPTVAVAEFDGDELLHVAPCRDDDRTIDVADRLEALLDDAGASLTVDEGSSDGLTDRSSERATDYGQSRVDPELSRSD